MTKRTYLSIILAVFACSIMQTSFLLEIFDAARNPALILCLCFALYLTLGKEYGLFAALVGGVLLDMVTFNVIGLSALLYIVFIYFANIVRSFVLHGFKAQVFLFLLMSISTRYFGGVSEINNLIIGSLLDMLVFALFYWFGSSAAVRGKKSGFRININA